MKKDDDSVASIDMLDVACDDRRVAFFSLLDESTSFVMNQQMIIVHLPLIDTRVAN